jgi:Tol biopolymer transport system component
MLKLLTPDGNTFRDLAAFQRVSIYPILWSPDGSRIAFAVSSFDVADGRGQDVYLIGSDGRNLQQVYHSTFVGINTLSFSADGGYLVLPDSDATGQHIYAVDLSTLETHMLQAPGLPLDWWWLAPSWRP